ncbi:IclR family transcriptional regulator [Kiloniella sp. EL199]|uniref:IclR family transcriptional regulator n=1 Tax=Kiloniella sp. EL199 TaxID=2107581 RepID=UPI000E9FFC60|nr:IclR family transcriptional regulator [Kiloniella sp. EL199]
MNVKQQSKPVQTSSLTPNQVGVGLLHKAFELLNLFQMDRVDWSQSEIIEATGVSRSTVSRLVRYLVETGYLAEIPKTGRYSLGMAAINLGQRAQAGFDIRAICQPVLERLAKITPETIILTVFDKVSNSVVCVDQIESRRGGLRVFEEIGGNFPLHAGAAPRAILACLSDQFVDFYLKGKLQSFTKQTMIDKTRLKEEIEHIRVQGYAFSSEETYEGAAGISAAFLDSAGQPLGSLAIAFPVNRLDEQEQITMGRQLRKFADETSQLF